MASNPRPTSLPFVQTASPKSSTKSSRSHTSQQDEHQAVTAHEIRTSANKPGKRKKNRNRRRRDRRQSFLAQDDSGLGSTTAAVSNVIGAAGFPTDGSARETSGPFYRLGRDLSSTSLESEALLDHRSQPLMRPRKESRLAQSFRQSPLSNAPYVNDGNSRNMQSTTRALGKEDDCDDVYAVDDRTPLVLPPSEYASTASHYGSNAKPGPLSFRRRQSSGQGDSPRQSPGGASSAQDREYHVNNPPSMPSSPKLGPEMNYDDAVVTGVEFDFSLGRSVENRMVPSSDPRDMVIDIEDSNDRPRFGSPESLRRRRTVTLPVEEDVCFPTEAASELVSEDGPRVSRGDTGDRRRRRHRQWPDLSVLEDWSREQKEEASGNFRAKRINEPVLIEGRLRPQYQAWRREDEIPYRFTYFNEELQSTIHAQTITELVQLGGSFRELFVPDPPELEDSSDDGSTGSEHPPSGHEASNRDHDSSSAVNGAARFNSINGDNSNKNPGNNHDEHANGAKQPHHTYSAITEAIPGLHTPANMSPPLDHRDTKPKRYGPRPTFWLDVLCPTDAEMRVLAKTFGIHALTAEDIMMQEAREKVELFRHYYFINYRTFEQDPNSEDYLEPVNMYAVVFREGVLSFHFSQTPHPANVRRRIRQLMDYLLLSSDWIAYALIDDITDVFGPLIQAIEDEVDEIDETIMQMHTSERANGPRVPAALSPGDVLRRVGESRKKVMGMYRLLSNKADVVKGFAKRCNEHWEVAPKSEIGLYLGDIQDHILTMTSSLTYYETLLSRAHSNYLAQINMIMNERQEHTADVLGRLTVLGTIVLPMNIICGMWGMNVKVPGQDINNLNWFWSIMLGLLIFAFLSFYIAKRVYKIV